MRKMKDSGIEWIGEIPESWDIVRLKALFDFGKGLHIIKENFVDEGLPVISYGQIHAKFNTGVNVDDRLLRFVCGIIKSEYLFLCAWRWLLCVLGSM